MWTGYLSLAGNEIVNSPRALAAAAAAGLMIDCKPCDTLAEVLGEDPYGQVDATAPWWDDTQPQSWGFLGVFGTSVTGFDQNPVERNPTALVGDGSALGPLRRRHREIAWTVALFATGECEMAYGLEWLSAALRGAECSGGTCNGDAMCVYACCPGTSPYEAGELGDSELRHLYDVGLLDGPQVSELEEYDGVLVATVTFTLAAAKPFIYREPLEAGQDWVSLGGGDTVTNVDPDQVYQQCVTAKPCAQDPLCPPPALPPAPPVPRSPCYPTGRGTFLRSRISVSPLDQAAWLETVPVLEVRAGASDMRRLLIRFWQNPQGAPCDAFTDPCNACTDVNVGYLPAGSHLTIDGRVSRSVLECQQYPVGTATSTPTIYGPKGDLFQWPTLICPTGLCIEVWSDAGNTAADATARVLLVPRADMG
ncbi:hypothetical protein [Streptomyces sp. NPDC049879]|uniref:hypothetical protein n=1 Tax=Streptomyces sp. NPDC049879 TaxID=3365598 RepID=UPI0037914A22